MCTESSEKGGSLDCGVCGEDSCTETLIIDALFLLKLRVMSDDLDFRGDAAAGGADVLVAFITSAVTLLVLSRRFGKGTGHCCLG
jgi:hypothetical protein